jgi:pantothenate kinase type III
MLLTMDIGNPNITIGVFRADALVLESRLSTTFSRTEDQYAVDLMEVFRLYGLENCRFDAAILCSVVPSLDAFIRRAVEKVTGVTPLQVGPGTKTRIRLEAPETAIRTHTIESMQSGVVFGTASMIDGMCDRIEAELGGPAAIVATGGLARGIVPHCKHTIRYHDDLILHGLRLIYKKNS